MIKIDDEGWCIVVWIICTIMVGFLCCNLSKDGLVQDLCSKQQYDFCEVQETIYKLKEQGR